MRKVTAAFVFACMVWSPPFSARAAAQAGAPGDAPANEEEVYEIGPGIAPPRVTHQTSPQYKEDSRGFRFSGAVLLSLVVSSRGEPVHIRVVKPLQKDVDQSAVDCVREWRFEPAKKSGKPVAVRVTVEIRFEDL